MDPHSFCQKFNNAGQAVVGPEYKPVVLSWNTNDTENPWSAQARIVSIDGRVVLKILGNGSGVRIKDAKEQAAREGYEALRAIYPELNL